MLCGCWCGELRQRLAVVPGHPFRGGLLRLLGRCRSVRSFERVGAVQFAGVDHRFCALKCPVFRKREGGYSVERGRVTGWTVITSGNSCSTSSPGSRSSSITAWCRASASLQVEQRHCSSRNVDRGYAPPTAQHSPPRWASTLNHSTSSLGGPRGRSLPAASRVL